MCLDFSMTSPSTRRAIAPLRACGVAFALLLGSGAQAGVHCIPMFDCPGGYAGLDAKCTELGWHVIWFVRETDGTVTDRGFSCRHGSCVTAAAFADLVEKTKRAGNPSQAAREAFATQIPRWQALRASEPALFNERVKIVAEAKPAALALLATSAVPAGVPVYTHTVKANGANATRPAYDVVGGTRGAREVANAGVGQPCKLPLLLPASGGDGWGEFGPEFTPNRVTLCAPK
jgi:hypothetical protein